MSVVYKTKYRFLAFDWVVLLLFCVLVYIFWNLFQSKIIVIVFSVFIGVFAIYLNHILMYPIFILDKEYLQRYYKLRPIYNRVNYKIKDIIEIKINDKRKGYQSYPTMKVYYKVRNKVKSDFFQFTKYNHEDFEGLIESMKKLGINITFKEIDKLR